MKLNKLQMVIAVVLRELGREVYRTQVIKLVYFVDYLYARHTGHTFTGLQYEWSHYGPNALGNAIADEANELVRKGVLTAKLVPTIYDTLAEKYRFNSKGPKLELTPEPLVQAIIHDVVRKYGRLSPKAIAADSKKTMPFQQANQYEALKLAASPEYIGWRQRADAERSFQERLEQALEEPAILFDEQD